MAAENTSMDGHREDSNKQHYIELDSMMDSKGHLYAAQLMTDVWISPIKE